MPRRESHLLPQGWLLRRRRIELCGNLSRRSLHEYYKNRSLSAPSKRAARHYAGRLRSAVSRGAKVEKSNAWGGQSDRL